MHIRQIRTAVFREGDDLFAFITRYFKKLPEKSVVAVTSKIVALAEGRTAPGGDKKAKAKLIRAESEFALRTKYAWLTIKDGTLMASAGIDASNARGKFILLPRDSFAVAAELRKKLCAKYGVRHLGVLITDSRTLPLHAGVTGVALGYAGFHGIKDYRGTPDIFGRKLTFSRTDVADSLAAAAVLTMGEGAEQQPIALIEDAPIIFSDRTKRDELRIDPNNDLYRPIFAKLPRPKRGTKR